VMAHTGWIPPLGGALVLLVLAVLAGLGEWSAPAIYACLFAGIITWAVLFAITDRGQRSSHR